MRTISELKFCQHVKGADERTLRCSLVDYYPYGYDRKVRRAKRLSRQVGELWVDGHCYPETVDLDKGLAAVCVDTYTSEKNILLSIKREYFINGELSFTMKEEY